MNGEKKKKNSVQNNIFVQVKRGMSRMRTVKMIKLKVMKNFMCNNYISAWLIAGKGWQMASHCLRSGHA